MKTEKKVAHISTMRGCLSGNGARRAQYLRRCELERLQSEGYTHIEPIGGGQHTRIETAIDRCNRAGASAYEYEVQREQKERERREESVVAYQPYADWLDAQAAKLRWNWKEVTMTNPSEEVFTQRVRVYRLNGRPELDGILGISGTGKQTRTIIYLKAGMSVRWLLSVDSPTEVVQLLYRLLTEVDWNFTTWEEDPLRRRQGQIIYKQIKERITPEGWTHQKEAV